jgi:phosphoribosylglycinamide formyltransferase 1
MTGEARNAGVVLLCTDDDISRIVYHALRERFGAVAVVVEEPVSRTQLLRRRTRTLGARVVLGQLLFMGLVTPLLRLGARERIEEICRSGGLLRNPMRDVDVTRVASVNDPATHALLKELAPRVAVINGTRILSAATLAATGTAFINTHLGITPLYRGVHGGYWALAERRADLAGTTIHYVDRGIDTGGVIRQVPFEPGPRDNFVTYPYLQIATALPALLDAVATIAEDGVPAPIQRPDLPSRLRSHPTLGQYLRYRFGAGAR